jgi:Ca-activated chloride channel family protein
MKKLLLLIVCFWAHFAVAQKQTSDKTLSPYFWVKSKDSKADQMPLKHTEANVSIAGTIADVVVTQVYKNEGKEALEAIYVFPGSTKSAVYAMTMTIGKRRLVAKIEEKNKAREQYETAKEEGKTASLLEQINPNVFQMNVANIMPNDEIKVELRYTELIEPTEGVYEFAYPTVVGPRYSEAPADAVASTDKWVANPYTKEGKAPQYSFDFKAVLNAGLPIQDITCISHKTDIMFAGKNLAKLSLDKKEKEGGNKDVVVRFRLAGGQVETGMLVYEGENAVASAEEVMSTGESEKFFMVMMQPPKAPTENQIPPREYVFIVDVSGSMHGFPLGVTKELLKNLIGKLRPIDKFNVMLFESSNQMLSPESMQANQANIDKAIEVINQQRGSGGTRLLPALQNALAFKESEGFSRSFVVVTDGYVSVEKEAFDLIKNKLNEANLFAFGIGSAVNRYLIEGMAHVGQGEPFFVYNEAEAGKIAQKFQKYVEHPVLTRINIKYEGFEAYDIEPATVPDVFAERPIIVYGKYRGKANGKITISGISGNQKYSKTFQVSEANAEKTQAIRYLWARNKIRNLNDYNRLYPSNEQVKMVTNLGLKYNLLTEYTSFIAIDDEVRNKTGKIETVKQALPLPEGVTNYAIGNTSVNAPQQKMVRTRSAERGSNADVKGKKSYGATRPVVKEKDVNRRTNFEVLKQEAVTTPMAGEVVPPTNGTENLKVTEDEMPKVTVDAMVTEEVKKDDNQIYTIVQQMPEYIGGMEALKKFIKDNLKFEKDICEGKVFVRFVIGKDGKVKDVRVVKSTCKVHDKEAMRVIQLTDGNWKAGKLNGKEVDVYFTIPIIFKEE